MTQIDWSEAPEGYQIWIECLLPDGDGTGWHKDAGDRWVDMDGMYWFKGAEDRGSCKVYCRPATTQWSGEGLPPVGVVCEVDYCESWQRCEVIAHFQQRCGVVAAFTVEYGDRAKSLDAFGAESFRPIRTPEQIAADEREAAIYKMLTDTGSDYTCFMATEIYADLYDAGYRKTNA